MAQDPVVALLALVSNAALGATTVSVTLGAYAFYSKHALGLHIRTCCSGVRWLLVCRPKTESFATILLINVLAGSVTYVLCLLIGIKVVIITSL